MHGIAAAVPPTPEAVLSLSSHAGTIERDDGSRIDMTRAIGRKRCVDTSFEICPGLYQAISRAEGTP